MFECEHCESIFETIKIMKKHQKNAKYCLKIQEEKKNLVCEGCNKKYSTKYYLKIHHNKCIDYQINKREKETVININTINNIDNSINNSNTTNNIDNSINNNTVNYIKNIDCDTLKNIIESISAEKIASPEACANKIFRLCLKDYVFYKDLARKILTYARDDSMVIDKGGSKLTQYIFSENIDAIKSNVKKEIDKIF